MSESVRWLYAIDDPLLRARFLDHRSDDNGSFDIVDIEHAYDQAVDSRPQAIVVDDSHPGTAVLCARLRRECPASRIIVLTAGHREGAWHSLCAGAFSVIDARVEPATLHAALIAAARGESLLDAPSSSMLLAHLQHVSALHDDPFVNIARLTLVEETVLEALAAGSSISDVATTRQVTARAVSLHLGFAVRRLHQHTLVSSQPALTAQVLAMRVPVSAGSADTNR